MGVVAFTGRLLVCTLFLISGVTKLSSYDAKTGGPMVSHVAPKMECFLNTVEEVAGVDLPLDIVKEQYGNLILAAGILEVAGAILFILDFSFGAVLMMIFLLGVSPVMHNFWDHRCHKGENIPEMINFMKNLSIFGGLMAYVGKIGKYRKSKMD